MRIVVALEEMGDVAVLSAGGRGERVGETEGVTGQSIQSPRSAREAYSGADNDLVAGWLKIRNQAAHNLPECINGTEAALPINCPREWEH
jgi:hypothetical protein